MWVTICGVGQDVSPMHEMSFRVFTGRLERARGTGHGAHFFSFALCVSGIKGWRDR